MDHLTSLSAEALRQRYAETVLLHERTQHVGRANRIFEQIRAIGEQLVARGGASERELLPLLHHPSGTVRHSVAFKIRPFNPDLFMSVMQSLIREGGAAGSEAQSSLEILELRAKYDAASRAPDPPPDPNWLRIVNWQESNPPPRAMTAGQFEDRVLTEFSAERAKQILSLARPAIGLWPQRQPVSDDPLASRHGGEVLAPSGWQWPVSGEEPQCFLAQINCGDLAGLAEATPLPHEGIMTFFGDFELISGCFPESDGDLNMVCHFPAQGLMPAEPTAPPLDEYLREYSAATPLLFRPFIDLPHPFSHAIAELDLSDEETGHYCSLRNALVQFGIPDDVADHCDLDSKLLGWPSLIQHDFDGPLASDNAYRLLAQLPARMGPGGSIYFFIREEDLAQGRFDRCAIEEQNT